MIYASEVLPQVAMNSCLVMTLYGNFFQSQLVIVIRGKEFLMNTWCDILLFKILVTDRKSVV